MCQCAKKTSGVVRDLGLVTRPVSDQQKTGLGLALLGCGLGLGWRLDSEH